MKLAWLLSASLLVFSIEVDSSSAQDSDLDSQLRRGSTRFGEASSFRMSPVDVHPSGDYGGVQPGVTTPRSWSKRRPVKNRARQKNIVRWIGFQPQTDGRSRLFVQLTGTVEFTQELDGKDLVVMLAGARLGGSNARRPLDTRFFKTVVRRAVATRIRKRGASGVALRISFKNPADAAKASADLKANETDGYAYLFLDFGAASGASGKAEAEDAEAETNGDDDDDEGVESVDDE